jgi:hypothetical protein
MSTMPSLFDLLRGQRANQNGQPHGGRRRTPVWAEEFANPARPGRLSVQPAADQWRVVNDQGAVMLLCDKNGSVRGVSGDRLLSLAPNIAGTIGPRASAGVIDGLMDFALGTTGGSTPTGAAHSAGPRMSSWLIRETAGPVVAHVDAQEAGIRIDLLPGGALNDKIVARRFSPALAAGIRALGPLTYTIITGSPLDGVGQLRGPAGQVVATDRFTYGGPVHRAGALRHDLAAWTITVENNPFPLAWLMALLRTTKTVD